MHDKDPLVEVDPEERWEELDKVLKEEWPRTMTMYCFLKTRRRWKNRKDGTDFKLFCPGGDLKNGLISFGAKDVSSFYVLLHSFDGCDPNILVDAILRSKLITWTDHSCCCMLKDNGPWVRDLLKRLGATITKDLTTDYYELPTEKALAMDLKCPDGSYVAPLKPKDLIKVDSVWPQSFEGSIRYLKDMIKYNPSMGVFNSDNVLMSWMLTYEVGDVGVLQTDEEFKRKGYGSLVTKALARQIAERGDTVYCMIVIGNEASENMFKKLGFSRAETCCLTSFEMNT